MHRLGASSLATCRGREDTPQSRLCGDPVGVQGILQCPLDIVSLRHSVRKRTCRTLHVPGEVALSFLLPQINGWPCVLIRLSYFLIIVQKILNNN